MREPFAHDATLLMAADHDLRAPGAAVTQALCGQWDHDPPCPLAPHHCHAERAGSQVRLRILFATEPAEEAAVRRHIESALTTGYLRGPDGSSSGWELLGSAPSEVRVDEMDHARRLVGS